MFKDRRQREGGKGPRLPGGYATCPTTATIVCAGISMAIDFPSRAMQGSLGQLFPETGHLTDLFSPDVSLSADRVTNESHSTRGQRGSWAAEGELP